LKILFLPLVLFLVDQVSKISVRGLHLPLLNINYNGFSPGETKPVITNIIHITLVENPGIAFGIDPGESLREVILVITILTCIGFFSYLVLMKNADTKIKISVAFILGGAAGNLFDRIFYGYFYNYAPLFQGNVVDFLDIKFFRIFIFDNIHGNYVFNFADICILSGVVLLIYIIMSSKKSHKSDDLVPMMVEEREEKD
jgi:signal peptidase II